jgi:hypothetical protein
MKRLLFVVSIFLLAACTITQSGTMQSPAIDDQSSPAQTSNEILEPTPIKDTNYIPQFVNTNYFELEIISKISLFRSSVGHDYSDDYEHCRSMKHYFMPYQNLDWSTVRVFSPVDGIIETIHEEWAGNQIHIRSSEYPQFVFIIFHLNLKPDLHPGSQVVEGIELGTHIGNQTTLDIAVRRDGDQFRYHSFFDLITDSLFAEFQARGVQNRTDLIIPREDRDQDLLSCEGESFSATGSLPQWFELSHPDD